MKTTARGLTAHQRKLGASLRKSGHTWRDVAHMVGASVHQVRYALDPKMRSRQAATPGAAEMRISLPTETVVAVSKEAKARRMEPADLIARLVTTIAADGIFQAVIDE